MAERSPIGEPELELEVDSPPWQRVEVTLMATSQAIRRLFDVRLSAAGVTLPEASLLSYVHQHGPLTQIRLAAAMGMGRASTGARVAALEQRKLLTRRADPHDARAWLVDTSPAGRQLVTRIAAIDRSVQAELRSGIDREERQQLARMLVRIQHNVQLSLGDEHRAVAST